VLAPASGRAFCFADAFARHIHRKENRDMPHTVDPKEPARVREQRILLFWKEHAIFEKSQEQRSGATEYVFYEGPPTANGRPHPGHVLTRVYKDVYPRHRTMKGMHVQRKAGWDTHGLPVEIEIEKKFGISGKKQIAEFGIERFIQECRSSVFQYEATWRDLTERLGYWTDLDHAYMTLTDDYIESVWHLLRTIHDKGLLVAGHRVSPYCPHCETTLSSHEVAQGYKDVKDLSVTARFRLTSGPWAHKASLLAWTTTPWTLPSNIAVAVHPDQLYAVIDRSDEHIIVADALADHFLREQDRVVERLPGSQLAGTTYEPLFPYVRATADTRAFVVVLSDHVTADSGTGAVHMAPAFGEDDYRVCRDNGLLFCNFVDASGHFTADVADFAGRFVKSEDLNVDIVKHLATRDLVFEKHRHEHAYPHCWRCDSPLLYYAIDSWFIRTTAVKQQLLEQSDAIRWIPDNIRTGRMGNFLESLVDWNLSRSRYWGTPLPIWRCSQCAATHCVGSRAELLRLAGRLPSELHKPYIDELVWECECGGTMERIPDVIDVWFDSGSMPFAQLHYPFAGTEDFNRLFPADFIAEAVDQTRGWFYTLLAIATIVTGKAPYKTALVMGHVLDEQGKKMSKSRGNVIDPFVAFDQHGADALRFYFLTNTQPWNSQLFYHKAVAEAKSRFIDLLQNIHAFYALYASIDGYQPGTTKAPTVQRRPLMDRWILARLAQTITTVDDCLDAYNATDAGRSLQAFVEDLSTWYVRRNRERFWAAGVGEDKIAAFATLFTCLYEVARMTAPFCPFVAEDLYQNITAGAGLQMPQSVHLCDFATVDPDVMHELASWRDDALTERMQRVMRVVEMGRALRNQSRIKTRQPLSTLYVATAWQPYLSELEGVVLEELNVKEIRYADLDAIAVAQIHLDLRAVGQAFAARLPEINRAAKAATAQQARAFAHSGRIELAGSELTAEHGHVVYTPSFAGVLEVRDDGFVALSTELTAELVEEGYVREIVSKMQMMRKEVNYGVTSHVSFYCVGDDELIRILERHAGEIGATVLATAIIPDAAPPHVQPDLVKDWDVNGKKLTIAVLG